MNSDPRTTTRRKFNTPGMDGGREGGRDRSTDRQEAVRSSRKIPSATQLDIRLFKAQKLKTHVPSKLRSVRLTKFVIKPQTIALVTSTIAFSFSQLVTSNSHYQLTTSQVWVPSSLDFSLFGLFHGATPSAAYEFHR